MHFDDDLTACADLVRQGDPDRFLATMAAPPAARAPLFALYAFNVEVSRAPWVSAEPMIGEMRLQWWRDALDEIAGGGPARRHQVVTPLARLLTPGLARGLDALVEARRWDLYRDPFEDTDHFERHIAATSGTLLEVAAALLGQDDPAPVVPLGRAMGLANWLRALPALESAGRIPLIDGTPAAIAALARAGLADLARARAARRRLRPGAAPALLAAWQTGPVLRQAARDPARVALGTLGQSEAARRLSLMLRAATARW
ncbi:MAG: squalene/phytoene synthase family protein [Rhodobacteraceae bacterium]|nr:squalene/phytoene synthase family protein [Paracoccaceae bacterium]